jgi:predicted kinase
MEAIILIGIQGSGKSTFCRQKLFDSHVRINLDMLKTRNKERLLLEACLYGKQAFVVDNTNPTVDDRAAYIEKAKKNGFKVIGYYFKSNVTECLARNAARDGKSIVPEKGLLGTYKRLKLPTFEEGFDELYYIESSGADSFAIKEWQIEI